MAPPKFASTNIKARRAVCAADGELYRRAAYNKEGRRIRRGTCMKKPITIAEGRKHKGRKPKTEGIWGQGRGPHGRLLVPNKSGTGLVERTYNRSGTRKSRGAAMYLQYKKSMKS